MGTECLYITQPDLAGQVSAAISWCGLLNRGPKKRTDLFFLNNTEMPAILIETCFVDSAADAAVYQQQFDAICAAIASVLGGAETDINRPPPAEQLGRSDAARSRNSVAPTMTALRPMKASRSSAM